MKVTKFGVHIKSKNIHTSRDFYLKFELKPIFAYGNSEWLEELKKINPKMGTAPDTYEGVTFELGNSVLELANAHPAVPSVVFQTPMQNSKISAMIDVNSVSEVERICNENGFRISVPIKEYPWGAKEIVIKDPDGFVLVFREFLKK